MNKSPHATHANTHFWLNAFTMHDLVTGAGTERPLAPDSTKPGGRGGKRT